MQRPLVYRYDNMGDAENARDALVAAGFPEKAIELTAGDDGADATQGNLVAGDGKPVRRGGNDATLGSGAIAVVLAVTCTETERQDDAVAIMEELGGTNIARRAEGTSRAETPPRH